MRTIAFLGALATAGALGAASPAAAQTTPEVTAFCDAGLKADKASNAAFSTRKPSNKVQGELQSALSEVESTAPAEIAPTVQTVVNEVRTAVQQGNEPDEEVLGPNLNMINEYRYNSCGYQQLDVTGIEYEFQGLPRTLPAGKAAIRFTDNGAEIHELDLVRVKSKDSAKKVAGMSEKDLAKKTENVANTFVSQGQTSYTIADVSKPGRYVAICHLPVGATSDQALEHAGHDAKTHAQQGMYQEIRVTASSTATSAP